jgi:bla regulator protein blaR1
VAQRAFRTGTRSFAFATFAFATICSLMAGQRSLGQAAAAPVAPAFPRPSAPTVAALAAGLAEYDLTSVRPVDPKSKLTMMGLRYTPDGFQSQSVSVPMLVRAAYGGFMKLPTDDRVTGLPDWAKTSTYAVEGKMNQAQAAAFAKLSRDQQEQIQEQMLQALLLVRFKLTVHRESKQVPVYELVVVKTGPRLKEDDSNPAGAKGADGKPLAGSYLRMLGMGKVAAHEFTMEQLANFLMQPPIGLGRPVMDKTGLAGRYNFTLEWTPDPAFSPASAPGPVGGLPPNTSGPSIFTALEEQLGLRLRPATGTIAVIAIDHVTPPQHD